MSTDTISLIKKLYFKDSRNCDLTEDRYFFKLLRQCEKG